MQAKLAQPGCSSYGLFIFSKSGVQIMTLKLLNVLAVRSCLVGPVKTELHEIQSGPVS